MRLCSCQSALRGAVWEQHTWKDLSRLCQIQLRWMSSTTALPGCRNCALARLDVWTLTRTAELAITSSCSLKGVLALNSTTLTCMRGDLPAQ